MGWKWVELIKGKDAEASGTVGVWESESQGHLLWSSVLTGSTTREEPREAELARTMLPVCGPWKTLDQYLSTLCQCLSSLGEWSVMVTGTPAYNTAPAKSF